MADLTTTAPTSPAAAAAAAAVATPKRIQLPLLLESLPTYEDAGQKYVERIGLPFPDGPYAQWGNSVMVESPAVCFSMVGGDAYELAMLQMARDLMVHRNNMPVQRSRELSTAITKVDEALLWLSAHHVASMCKRVRTNRANGEVDFPELRETMGVITDDEVVATAEKQ